MKKQCLFILLALMAFTAGYAKEVTVQQAKQHAIAFMRTRGVNSVGIRSISAAGETGNAYYIINLAPEGWIIVSADDVVVPVLGYSKSGSLDSSLLPENMHYLLNEYEQQILKLARIVTSPHRGWTDVAGVSTRASEKEIPPLIEVNWNQSEPYNKYCPQKKALVGCVAVAMSQAMSVQHWPVQPKGNISYTSPNYGGLSIDFSKELSYDWNRIMAGSNNFDETARLLYHAGMSVRMNYGEDGSGIPSNEVYRISEALINNFSYPESVSYYWRDEYEGDWEQLLLNELNAGRAIIYNAVDTQNNAGHSFNIDGYDGKGHFHVNWGWGGYGNGEFSIDNLRDAAMQMDYDAYHVVVVGIGAPNQTLRSISLSNNKIEEGLPYGSVIGSVKVNGEDVKSIYDVTVHGTYNSANGSYEQVPFKYENGMLKTTEVLNAEIPKWDIEITVKDTESNTELTQIFRIVVEPWKSIEETTTLKYDRQRHTFRLTTKHNVTYVLKGADGSILEQGALDPLPELNLDASALPAGENSLELKCADEIKTIRIISKLQ